MKKIAKVALALFILGFILYLAGFLLEKYADHLEATKPTGPEAPKTIQGR